jgi:hypothetical protein
MAVAAGAIWYYFFPSPERAIENRLKKLSKVISANVARSNIKKIANANRIAGFFAPDVVIHTEGFSRLVESLNGRNELMQAIIGARAAEGNISAEFYNINIQVAEDKESAIVDMTVIVKIPDQSEPVVGDVKALIKKTDGKWLIQSVEPSKTKLPPG